jgi:mannose-6-phosphate isomerase-like protein (cupin superfamily)
MLPKIQKIKEDDEYYFKEGCHILELLNTEDDASVSIARARVRPGVTTRLHRLSGITERYVILQGRGCVEVERLGKQSVGPGDVVTIPPRFYQRITNEGNGDLIFLAICTPRFIPEAYEVA